MPIQVIYTFEVNPNDAQRFEQAWTQIVHAHAGHGALGSSLLRSEEEPNLWCAVSRWVDRDTWERNRTDAAHPEAYAVFRECADVLTKHVFEQRQHIVAAPNP